MQTMTRRAWIGLVTTVVATSAITATATTAVANHQFSDIPVGSFFHDEIAAIYDSGCAGGYDNGTFRSGNSATRGQFALWLNNCGGRAAFANDGSRSLTSSTEQNLATAVVTAGAMPTGGGFLVAFGSVAASSPGCATTCVAEFRLYRGGNSSPTESVAVALGENAPGSGSLQTVLPVDGGSETTMRLAGARTVGGDPVTVEGSLALLYVPFAGDGTGGGLESAPD
jgi:hypothetical protein